MYDAPPVEHRPADLVLSARCGAATSGPRTKGVGASLDRWVALRDAIVDWAADPAPDVDRIEQAFFGLFDPVQRSILVSYFARCREAIGDADVDPEPPAARVVSDDGRTMLRQAVTFLLEHPEGDREAICLKLGKPSTAEAAAVLSLGADPEATPADLLADLGHVEPIDVDPTAADAIISSLFEAATRDPDPTPRPGSHCWTCDRTATCGAYRDPWDRGRPPASTRTVKLARSTLSWLGTCERRVAWKSLFQLPTPDDDGEPGPGLLVGSTFHTALASALLDEDPDGVVETHARALPGSEQADLLHLWDRHLGTVAEEPFPVAVSTTEYPIGLTIPVPEHETAVVVIGTVDAAGREADGTPAVIEHRTGRRTEIPDLEAELYAVATWQTTGSARVAVHHHHLRSDDEPCRRQVFGETDLHEALESIRAAATTIAGWDPDDALAVPYSVGAWCAGCPFEPRCREWRSVEDRDGATA